MKRVILLSMFVLAVILPGLVCAQESLTPQEAALKVAETWLAKLDQGLYDECWQDSAEYFRAAVDQETSIQYLKAFRAPLGNVISRTVVSQDYMLSLPGAPDGEYVVIVFKTEFENKKEGYETITPQLDVGGDWRVSGYYIK